MPAVVSHGLSHEDFSRFGASAGTEGCGGMRWPCKCNPKGLCKKCSREETSRMNKVR